MPTDAFSVHPGSLVTAANGFNRAAGTVRAAADAGGVQAPGALGPVVDAAFGAFCTAWRAAGDQCAATAEAVGPGLRGTAQAYLLTDHDVAGSFAELARDLPPGR